MNSPEYNPVFLSVTIATRLCVTTADAIVVAVTWRKTFLNHRRASQLGIKTGISTTMLRDGKWRFYYP